MINDGAPYRVFKISELARLIANQLILVSRNKKSAVNFACVCRYLEEPALSTLWETQQSLCTLLKTLPRDTRGWQHLESGNRVVRGRDLPFEESKA